jgi:acyl-CoA thioester hydrolase
MLPNPTANPAPSPATTSTPVPRHFPIRVYWEDTDAGGVVFYANYLKFFERARTEWLRSLGVEQQALRDRTGAIFIVSRTNLRYLAPARLDDQLEISVVLQSRGAASMVFVQQALRGGALLAEGEIRIGCVDEKTFRPRRIPDYLMARLA